MSENTLMQSFKIKSQIMTFFILCSLYVSENVHSRDHWTRDFMIITYNAEDGTVDMRFQCYAYHFGPGWYDAYLEWCDFEYSTDNSIFVKLMRVQTPKQGIGNNKYWTSLSMIDKLAGAQIQFNGCFYPQSGTMWTDDKAWHEVKVFNTNYMWAWFTPKWILGKTYQDVKYIRVTGNWHVSEKGWPDESINEVYNLATTFKLKSDKLQVYPSSYKAEHVYKDADAVVVKGLNPGANINVYTTSGLQIKSIITNNYLVKIKLPANQVYIINLGQSRYKLTL